MAKSTSKTPKIQEMPKLETAVAVEDPPTETQPTPFDETPPEKTAAPPPKTKNNVPPKSLTFFQRVNSIPFEDWGTRAKVKVYRLAPLIDRLRGSENKFIRIYEEALTEDRLKVDSGSGRYRLYLTYKGAGQNGEKELDTVEVDILDPKFPPNIPPGEWMDDPRNSAWAWAKPAANAGPHYPTQYPAPTAAPVAAPAEAVVQGMRLATEMRKELREEMAPPAPAPIATMAAPAAVDPWAAAERILNMRSDNPMVTILQTQLSELRAQMEKRDEKLTALQTEVWTSKLAALEARLEQKAAPAKGILEQAKELAEALGIAPGDALKRFMGGTGEPVVRSRMSGNLELAETIINKVFDSPIPSALSNWLNSKTTPQPQNNRAIDVSAQNGQTQQNGNASTDPNEELFRFVNEQVTEKLIQALNDETDGDDFANAFFVMYPQQRLVQLQNLTHPMIPGLKGAPVIIKLYQQASGGQIWRDHLAKREAQFRKFVEDFCAWKPDEPDQPQQQPDTGESVRTTGGDF